jgi:meso-butanediol dehydrogenase/(S,S)-butanediol dehydrogenase/diacetyl reductase
MNSLTGKVAVVTGASRGIGAAVARPLADRGVGLGLASRSGDLGILGAVARPCDVRDAAQVDALVAGTVELFGRLDILVANAGVGAYAPFLELHPNTARRWSTSTQGHPLRRAQHASASAQERWRGHRHALVRGGRTRAAARGGLLRVQVRPGRRLAGARPRAARAWRALHERLPGWSRDRVRARGRPQPARVGARGHDERRGVAEVVLFVLTRPRKHHILETALRPMTEASWG